MSRSTALLLAIVWTCAACAHAAIPGYVENFDEGTAAGFGGGAVVTVIASGGADGATDGYIQIARSSPAPLGVKTEEPEFTGTLIADGVTGFSFALNDVGADEDLEIHVSVGRAFDNVWQFSTGFSPPENDWQEFSVDITESTGWAQIIGTGTFEDAVANTDRLLFRHDTPPFVQQPTLLAGDFGLDRVTVLPEPVAGMLVLVAAPLVLGRRRAASRS